MLLPPVILEDEFVVLRPIELSHLEGLYQACQLPSIWRWYAYSYCESLEATKLWIENCIENNHKGQQQAFVIVDKMKDKIVGSSSYLNIDLANKAIEIGSTFLAPEAQRSHINRRCKLMLLSHAFETLQVNRVALQTHEHNSQSRNAILGIGAQFEGILRMNRVYLDGSVRSSAFYSVIKPHWQDTKSRLMDKISHHHVTSS
jgi:N-acetyltransferase